MSKYHHTFIAPAILFFLILQVVACGSDSQSPYAKIKSPTLVTKKIIAEEQVLAPIDLLVVNEHLLVIDSKAKEMIKIFDHSGTLQGTFGRKGEGPGEFIFASQLLRGNENGTFWLYDIQKRRAQKFLLNDVLAGKTNPLKIVILQAETGIPLRLATVHEDEFIGIGTFVDGRVSHYDEQGKAFRKIGPFPAEEAGEFRPEHAHAYDGSLDFDPERNLIYVAPWLGSVVDVFDLNGGKVADFKGPEIFHPEYDIVAVSGTPYHSMTYNKKSRFGIVETVFHQESDCWYFLYSGKKMEHDPKALSNFGRELICATGSGQLRGRYRLDIPLMHLALAPDGTLFGMAESTIVKFRLDQPGPG